MKNIVKKNATRLKISFNIMGYEDYRAYLSDLYQAVKAEAHRYSYLQFSEDLGFQSSNLMRLIIIGQRNLNTSYCSRIGTILGLSSEEKKYFKALVAFQNEKVASRKKSKLQDLIVIKNATKNLLDERHISFFQTWLTSVIREMVSLPGFELTAAWLQKNLVFKVRKEEIEKSIEVLKKFEFIEYDSTSNSWKPSSEHVFTQTQIDDLNILNYHHEMLHLSQESISQVEQENRLINCATVKLSDESAAKLKKKMGQLIAETFAQEEKDCQDPTLSVYQLNVQFFDLITRNSEDKK